MHLEKKIRCVLKRDVASLPLKRNFCLCSKDIKPKTEALTQ